MRRVLDEELLNGVENAEVRLRPARSVRVLADDSWEDAVSAVGMSCQLWGGVADLFVPVDGGGDPHPGYQRLVDLSELDSVTGLGATWAPSNLKHGRLRRLPTLIALASADKDRLKTLRSSRVPDDDPWQLAYLAALGYLPPTPNPSTLDDLHLNPDLVFETVVRFAHDDVETPGVQDLRDRLVSSEFFDPVRASWHALRSSPAKTTHAALDGWLADPAAFARQHGPAIIVMYTPQSVADLCLIWNLRALHGWPDGLPLAVPYNGDPDETAGWVDELTDEQGGLAGLGGTVLMSSSSLSLDALREVAGRTRTGSKQMDFAQPDDVLRPMVPPARSAEVALAFHDGTATVAVRTDRDRAELEVLERLGVMKSELRLSVALTGRPLPPTQSLDGGLNGQFVGGARVLTANADGLRTFNWPSGMTTLRALAADRGVSASPSQSGRSAMALLAAVGSVSGIYWLSHRPLLALLYKKAGSSGMTWWKERAREQADAVAKAAADPETARAEFLAAIDAVSVSHGGESAATIAFGELCKVLGGNQPGARWLAWAERRSLLIRGATVTCPHCKHKAWRTLADLAPPLTCSGCGRSNDRPFNESAMPFSYRIGEPLRRCLEDDSIHHLLAMRVLGDILSGGPDKLVGLHPGVDFTRGDEQTEADVVAVLASGTIIPVEVKARSVGLREHDLELLDRLADWLDAPTVILATSDADAALHPDFTAAGRTDLFPWRRILTAEDLYAWFAPVALGTRQPGPDESQDVETGPRKWTPEGLDAEFLDRLRAAGELDAASDPTAIGLPPVPR